MKILYLNGYFKLSDDFTGSFADGLIELGNYLKSVKETTYKCSQVITKVADACNAKTYPEFVYAVKNRQRRFYGLKSIAEADDNGYIIEEDKNNA